MSRTFIPSDSLSKTLLPRSSEEAKAGRGRRADDMSTPENKSYLAAGLGGLSPWGSRSATPKPATTAGTAGDGGIGKQQGGDHAISRRQRLSSRNYPKDCPPLNVRWFYAVDVPKRKPLPLPQPPKDAKPPPPPKKFVAFSTRDSRAVESAFQGMTEEDDKIEADTTGEATKAQTDRSEPGQDGERYESSKAEPPRGVKVQVNEDYLFDVDIGLRELAPVYWLGPIYEVRRGTWFYQEGSTLRTCDENLATQLEEGYLKAKPFRYPKTTRARSETRAKSGGASTEDPSSTTAASPKVLLKDPQNSGDARSRLQVDAKVSSTTRIPSQQDHIKTHRLFGSYMNSVVTYQDASTAWIVTDDFMSRMSSTVYQRFAGGAHFAGVRVVRGYRESGKSTETVPEAERKQNTGTDHGNESIKTDIALKRRSAPPTVSSADSTIEAQEPDVAEVKTESRRQVLERQMSNLVSSSHAEDPAQQEEEARKRDEQEIQDDYRDEGGEEQSREIEHLLLVTHGIGQRLGLRMESVNFIHDVNVLRKTLKSVYAESADLQALNSEIDKLPKNCRVQVLPVCWRHLLDFPRQSLRQNRAEHDLGDVESFGEDEGYPSLTDITVDGVPAVRNLITDLALDILLYQSSYREHIAGIVKRECNRIYRLFLDRNPHFHGNVSLIGHSLGSAILFDILCRQQDERKHPGPSRPHSGFHRDASQAKGKAQDLKLDFEVESFFCLGSPIGLFQMLKGRTIAGRPEPEGLPSQSPLENDASDDPFLGDGHTTTSRESNATLAERTSSLTLLPFTVSSPKCGQLFNIFHPTDPISYRIEPLISPAMSSLKPQPLPYTKKGIFGAQMGQGLTGISARVGQSVSGLWSSLSSGLASSILNRSLGITAEEAKLGLSAGKERTLVDPAHMSAPLSMGAGTNISGGNVVAGSSGSATAVMGDDSKKRKIAQDTVAAADAGEHAPTLIDSEIETLYAGFQKRRKSHQSDQGRDLGESPAWEEAEERGRRLRREEAKVRALNSTGRVDFSIQEGVFDISLIASIASHLSYWADEDVSHFMISQLLSRHRVLAEGKTSDETGKPAEKGIDRRSR
ncbi:MAG: hypothetical protein M1817_000656 [Caeruleum heppii]|nr:MAG: hypothetical protein M1817_000656 [Caeruleum heppii]